MSDYHRRATLPIAAKAHRCIACFGQIPKGEKHVHQTGYYDGNAYNNRYHNECWTAFHLDGFEEFIPGCMEIPKRILNRKSNHDQNSK